MLKLGTIWAMRLKQGKPEEAIGAFTKALHSQIILTLIITLALREQGKPEEAIEAFNNACQKA